MKKLALLSLVFLLLPAVVSAQCTKEGATGIYVTFPTGIQDIFAGQTLTYTIGPANFGGATDTFCLEATSARGWTLVGDPPLGDCFILDSMTYMNYDVSVTADCEAAVCEYDTVIATQAFCDVNGNCAPECGDTDSDTLILHVVESPPALDILQDSLTTVEQGQTAAYIPFSICNGDPCAPATTYDYVITSKGHVGAAINQSGTATSVAGGECEDVYGVIDAGAASVCDYDTLTIIAWDAATGEVYDTCVQLIHVITPESVPLFSTPVLTILVLAMLLSAAVFMRRRAANKA